MHYLDGLRAIVSPDGLEPYDVRWEPFEESWGIKFPADYKEFIQVYGPGEFNSHLGVNEPVVRDENAWRSPMNPRTFDARDIWEDPSYSRPGLEGDSPHLLAWGGAAFDIYCWDTRPSVPEDWPNYVYDRGHDMWIRYDVTMVEFIENALRCSPEPWAEFSLVWETPTHMFARH